VRPNRTALLLSALVLSACAANPESGAQKLSPPAGSQPAPTRGGAKSRRFALRYEATVKSAPAGSREVDLWLPVAGDTPFQTVILKSVSAPAGYTIAVEPTLGNRIFHVRVPASSLPLTVRLDYDVTRNERRTDLAAKRSGATLSPSDRDRYLAGSPLVPVGASVDSLSGFDGATGDSLAVARAAYDHVMSKMRYDKPANSGWGSGSTEWACKEGFGNCTDFHAYFMSLTRTHGIPSRFLMGMPLPPDKKEGEIAGYHCWAEFFAPERGWVPVDISEADRAADQQPEMTEFYFGGLTADRVEFSTGRDVKLVPQNRGGALNFFIYPYCEIDGREAPKDVIGRRFTFQDV